jgi:hypothetical protein
MKARDEGVLILAPASVPLSASMGITRKKGFCMFIVRLVGSDSDDQFKVFGAVEGAKDHAKQAAYSDIKLASTYEWDGDFDTGRDAIKAGLIKAILDYAHQETPPVPRPEPPIRVSPKAQEAIKEIIKKIPRVARKHTQT